MTVMINANLKVIKALISESANSVFIVTSQTVPKKVDVTNKENKTVLSILPPSFQFAEDVHFLTFEAVNELHPTVSSTALIHYTEQKTVIVNTYTL